MAIWVAAGGLVVLSQGERRLAQQHQHAGIGRIVDQGMAEVAGRGFVFGRFEVLLSLARIVGRSQFVDVGSAAPSAAPAAGGSATGELSLTAGAGAGATVLAAGGATPE